MDKLTTPGACSKTEDLNKGKKVCGMGIPIMKSWPLSCGNNQAISLTVHMFGNTYIQTLSLCLSSQRNVEKALSNSIAIYQYVVTIKHLRLNVTYIVIFIHAPFLIVLINGFYVLLHVQCIASFQGMTPNDTCRIYNLWICPNSIWIIKQWQKGHCYPTQKLKHCDKAAISEIYFPPEEIMNDHDDDVSNMKSGTITIMFDIWNHEVVCANTTI